MDLQMNVAAICLSHMSATSSTITAHAVTGEDTGIAGYTYDKPVCTIRSW